jgi:hypothetical protein
MKWLVGYREHNSVNGGEITVEGIDQDDALHVACMTLDEMGLHQATILDCTEVSP